MADRLRLSIEIDAELRESLARWADEERRPVANLLRHIVAAQVERHERKRAKAEATAA